MYIEIGNTIGAFLKKTSKKNSNTEKITEKIEKILYQAVLAVQEGKHCVNIESEECAIAIVQNIQNKIVRNFFYYIYENYSTYLPGFKEKLSNYIRIDICSTVIEKKELSKNKYITVVNQELAEKTTFWQSVCFLPENIRDYRFFSRIACFKKEGNYDKIKFAFTREQGQGSRAIDTYNCRCSENKFIFALLDNDISKPGENIKINSTAWKFKNSPYNTSPYGFFYILNIHELENLFSSKPFIAVVNEHMAEELEKYEKKSSDVKIYYDFKLGFSYKDLEINNYMQQFDLNKKSPCVNHIKNGVCPNRKCQVRVLDGLGSNYLERLFGEDPNFTEKICDIEYCIKNESADLFAKGYNELIDPIKKEWDRIYSYFLTYFCSYTVNIAGA